MRTHSRVSWWQLSTSRHLLALFFAGLLAITGVTSAAQENSAISLDLNADAVRLSGSTINPERKFRYDASFLHHQDRGTVVAGGFHITGNAATPGRPVNAGLGGRLVYADSKIINVSMLDGVIGDQVNQLADQSATGYGISLGGFFDAKLPNYDRVGFGGHIYYSPDILSFGDMTEFTDLWLYGSYSVLKRGELYVGVRSVKAEFEVGGDYSFDTGLHAGIKLKF